MLSAIILIIVLLNVVAPKSDVLVSEKRSSLFMIFFRISEKVSTPTSVILMAINTVTGMIYKSFTIVIYIKM
jgi:hypothetical protein